MTPAPISPTSPPAATTLSPVEGPVASTTPAAKLALITALEAAASPTSPPACTAAVDAVEELMSAVTSAQE